MASLTPTPRQQFFTAAGIPLVGGKIYTYAGGTTTPISTYVDQAGATANTNPIILDSRGEADIWLQPTITYKYVVTDPNDVVLYTVNNISVPVDNLSFGAPPAIGDIQPNSGAVLLEVILIKFSIKTIRSLQLALLCRLAVMRCQLAH
jgi:hypothetical protein